MPEIVHRLTWHVARGHWGCLCGCGCRTLIGPRDDYAMRPTVVPYDAKYCGRCARRCLMELRCA